ncbi:uncharacterized protein LOC127259042 [Andrographis paniculata]|uniref:uncharacterized protein LOC127259042 n=1 Tax=Andrographis paniculata TaxID=175694 RepID=UPI0021E9139C|nr:uncharacterized protein LOC127259042 [Andrographis paniculata]
MECKAEDDAKDLRRSCAEIELLNFGGESPVERTAEAEDSVEVRRGRKRKSEEEEEGNSTGEMCECGKMRKEELEAQLLLDCSGDVANIRDRAMKKLRKIEAEERNLREVRKCLDDRKSKITVVIDALDGRITAVEDKEEMVRRKWEEFREKEVQLQIMEEEKTKEIQSKEERLRRKMEEFGEKEVQFQATVEEKTKEIQSKEESLRKMQEEFEMEAERRESAATASTKEAELMKESAKKKMDEIERMRMEFDAKTQDLDSKESQLEELRKKLGAEAKVKIKMLAKKEKNGRELLEKLESSKKTVEEMKDSVERKLNTNRAKEAQINSLSDWVEMKMDELDAKENELKARVERVKNKEDDAASRKNQLDLKERRLRKWESSLVLQQREIATRREANDRKTEALDRREKILGSVSEFTRKCYKEYRATQSQLKHKERELDGFKKGLEGKQRNLIDLLNTYEGIIKDESAELRLMLKMNGKDLQAYLINTHKNSESMSDEIFRVLNLSSDPAKLVLGALSGFYPPPLRPDNEQGEVRKTCVLLLQQLRKMSATIKPEIQERAAEIGYEWKSKMRATPEHSLEVLGFLHLLDAYNLVSYFDQEEISKLLEIVEGDGQIPELRHRLLGYSDTMAEIAGYLENVEVPELRHCLLEYPDEPAEGDQIPDENPPM